MNTELNIIETPDQSINLDMIEKSIKKVLNHELITCVEAGLLLELGIAYYKEYVKPDPQDISLTRAGILYAKTFNTELEGLNRELNNSFFKKLHSFQGMDVFKIPITETNLLFQYTGKYMIRLATISRISTDLQHIYIYC